MNKRGRVFLRNKIERTLNSGAWAELGCKVYSGVSPGQKRRIKAKDRHFWRFVMGTAKDGRTILIYPLMHHCEMIPISIWEYMIELEERNALVGCALNLGDAWCIVSDNPSEYKRAQRTFLHQYARQRYNERKMNNGTSQEE